MILRRSIEKVSAMSGDEGIALGGAHHRQRDAGVAGRGLDDGLARLERALALRVLDDGDREAILDRADSGLKNSHFTYIVVPAGARRLMLTMGVRPMVPRMLS